MLPTITIRILVYLMFRDPHDFGKFQSCDFSLNIYWYTTFGIWTIENFIKMMHAPKSCGKLGFSMLKLCYHVLLILGIFPAVILLLGAIFVFLCIPYVAYITCKEKRRARFERRKREMIIEGLYSIKWDKNKFEEHEECCICTDRYTTKDTVIVLPCN